MRKMSNKPIEKTGTDLLTVELEDYYQVGSFHKIIQHGNWYRFEKRIEKNTRTALNLLDQFDIKATFFVLGWVAEAMPEIVKEVVNRGHEVASKGYYQRVVHHLSISELKEDLAKAREVLEKACGKKIVGYRTAHGWLNEPDLWILKVLAEEGYLYDSSVGLRFRHYVSEPWRQFIHQEFYGERKLWEFPLSSIKFGGLSIPIAGGNYYRQFPHTLVKQAVKHWHKKYSSPLIMYFHIWELDPDQPRISAGSLKSRIRHYRNLEKMVWILEDYFKKYKFTGIARYLNVDTKLIPGEETFKSKNALVKIITDKLPDNDITSMKQLNIEVEKNKSSKKEVTVVIPCYNEEQTLLYLFNTLNSVQEELEEYNLEFIFVDDCSKDSTWESLHKVFGKKKNCKMVRHEHNKGVAAAIITGIKQSKTDIVSSIDCDCTYDPHELKNMIPMLTEGVDLVTASPYHPQGKVLNVPAWRLTLSKSASFLYRRILRQKISTYTSCFRVYRKSAILGKEFKEGGFLGIAEVIGILDLNGSVILEYPTILESRMLGHSSMKTIRTIAGHLRLLSRLLKLRYTKNNDRNNLAQKNTHIVTLEEKVIKQ